MPDRDRTLNITPDPALGAALRALPDAGPQPDLWPDLARTLHARRRPLMWRYAVPITFAAGVALAMLLPRGALRHVGPETAPAVAVGIATATPPRDTAPAGTAELAGLHQRSQALERWIAAVAAHAPQDSRDLMAAVEVEDLIGLVDVQLGATRNGNDALPLWRQRVALLEDLATIRGSAFAVAANDDGRTTDASLNRLN